MKLLNFLIPVLGFFWGAFCFQIIQRAYKKGEPIEFLAVIIGVGIVNSILAVLIIIKYG